MQGRDIVLRLQGNLGMFRLTVKDSTTYQQLKTQAADLMKADANSLNLRVNGSRLSQSPNDPVYRIRGLEHGAVLEYDAKLKGSTATEEMGEKPTPVLTASNPITFGGAPPKGNMSQLPAGSPIPQPKPAEGKPGEPNAPAAPAEEKKKFNKDEAKHISFDLWLKENGALKPKEQKKSWSTDVFLPLEMNYKPRVIGGLSKMTMDVMPPSINMKMQQYRHIDYVQFMNFEEINRFVNFWVNSFEERVGWLYGYFAEDPDYELGIRAIVEAIYEPPQTGTYNNVELKDDPFINQVDIVAGGLGLQRIGWIYTSRDLSCHMSPPHIIKAAQYQLESLATHQLGYKVPKFISVVLKRNICLTAAKQVDEKEVILPEVFMISDMGTAMVRDGVFDKEQVLKTKLAIRPSDSTTLMPNVLVGSPQKEVDHEYFLVSINYGQPKTNKFAILKNSDFPPMNRKSGATREDLKKYLAKYGRRPLNERYSSFQLLLYLSREMDIDSALELANSVKQEAPASDVLDELIKSM